LLPAPKHIASLRRKKKDTLLDVAFAYLGEGRELYRIISGRQGHDNAILSALGIGAYIWLDQTF